MMPVFLELAQAADSTAVRRAFDLPALLTSEGFLRAVALLVIGLPLTYSLSRAIRNLVGRRYGAQRGLVAGKVVFYPLVLIVLVSVLNELGFSLAPILGAAGVLGIALGFASQTSVSNIISGLFLIGEQPFAVDDIIRIGSIEGIVLSVDTLSVKLRTFDNHFVRIPNETILKSEVVNLTRFPIRRLDTIVGVAYKEDLERVRQVLLDVADENPLALSEPAPMVVFQGYGESSIDFKYAVWTTRENFLALKNSLLPQVKARFDAEGIEIPFPHRTLYVGALTDPMPLRMVGGAASRAEEEGVPKAAEGPETP